MTDLLASLQVALNAARKSKDKDRTLLVGTVLSAVRNHEIALGRPLTDEDVVEVLRRGVKLRREAEEQFAQAGRLDLAERELAQVRIIEEFLPPEADPAEIRVAVREAMAGGARQLGAIMSAVMPRFKGRADGRMINQIVREELQAG